LGEEAVRIAPTEKIVAVINKLRRRPRASLSREASRAPRMAPTSTALTAISSVREVR